MRLAFLFSSELFFSKYFYLDFELFVTRRLSDRITITCVITVELITQITQLSNSKTWSILVFSCIINISLIVVWLVLLWLLFCYLLKPRLGMFLMRKLNNPPPTVVKLCSTEAVGKGVISWIFQLTTAFLKAWLISACTKMVKHFVFSFILTSTMQLFPL